MAEHKFCIQEVGSSTKPKIRREANNFIGIWSRNYCSSGSARIMYGRLYMAGTGEGEAIRAFATAENAATATGGTLNGLHATMSVATGGDISGAGNAARFTLAASAASRTLGGTLASVQWDSDIGTGNTLGANTAFCRVSDSGSVKVQNLFNFESTTSSCAVASGGTYSTADGYIKIRVAGSDMRIPYFAGTD